jgi:hypothetical protein
VSLARRATLVACVVAASLTWKTAASAFGGVYFTEDDRSVRVTGHRLAVALGRGQTVMWDQPTWTGNPIQVAYIALVRPNATVSSTADAWLTALAASSQSYTYTPPSFGPAAGCMVAGCARDPAFGEGPDRFAVTRLAVAAPLEQARLETADAALTWLADRGFVTSSSEEGDLRAAAQSGYQMVAMRYEPPCGARAIRPVRVESPATNEIPTRLMKAGVSSQLALTLFVLADKRVAPAPLTAVDIDLEQLTWDDRRNQSNYDDLVSKALGEASGRSVLTEYADVPTRTSGSKAAGPASFSEVYPALCGKDATPARMDIVPPESVSASSCRRPTPRVDAGDAGEGGAETDAGADADIDAEVDAGVPDADPDDAEARDARAATDAAVAPPRDDCPSPDDLALTLRGLDLDQIFFTRMRGNLSTSVLAAQDLTLVPAPGGVVPNGIQAVRFADDRNNTPNRSAACGSARVTSRERELGGLSIVACVLFVLGRQRRRK